MRRLTEVQQGVSGMRRGGDERSEIGESTLSVSTPWKTRKHGRQEERKEEDVEVKADSRVRGG